MVVSRAGKLHVFGIRCVTSPARPFFHTGIAEPDQAIHVVPPTAHSGTVSTGTCAATRNKGRTMPHSCSPSSKKKGAALPKLPVEIAVEEGQRCLKASPAIVLGSGASIPSGLPSMGQLADHLKASMTDNKLSGSDNTLWNEFLELLKTQDLESALQAIQLSDRLSDNIVEQTWQQTAAADARLFERIISDRNLLPLTRLYRHLFSSTNRTLSVVTPNYDRLAEYAADLAGYCHYTGFSYGYLRNRQSGKTVVVYATE